jgi:hypothetical protein
MLNHSLPMRTAKMSKKKKRLDDFARDLENDDDSLKVEMYNMRVSPLSCSFQAYTSSYVLTRRNSAKRGLRQIHPLLASNADRTEEYVLRVVLVLCRKMRIKVGTEER